MKSGRCGAACFSSSATPLSFRKALSANSIRGRIHPIVNCLAAWESIRERIVFLKGMQHFTFGRRNGLRVSEIALGTGQFGSRWGYGADSEAIPRIFNAFAEA